MRHWGEIIADQLVAENRNQVKDEVLFQIHSEIYPLPPWASFTTALLPQNCGNLPWKKKKKRQQIPPNSQYTTMTDNFNYATAELVTVTMCLNAKHRAPQRTQNALTEILKLYNTGIQKPHCPPQYNKKPSFFSLQSHWNSIFGSTFFLMKKNTLPSVLQWWPTWQGAGFPGRDHSVENKRIVMQIVLISCRFSPISLQGFYSSDNAALQVAQKQNLRYILKSI